MDVKGEVPDVESYTQLVGSMFVGGAVSMAMSLAQQTGMVEELTRSSQPLSSTDMAQRLHLKERYTREVLCCLAAMRLIQVEKGTGGKDGQAPRFFLPAQHRQAFQKTAIFIQHVSLLGGRFKDIKACFPLDAPALGIRYRDEDFSGIGDAAEYSKDAIVQAILKTPGLKEQLEKGCKALEVGCGTADVCCHLAAMFPQTQFLLTDVVPHGLDRARDTAKKHNLPNVHFQLVDIFHSPEDWNNTFDWVLACDVIHDIPYPLKGLEGIRKVLKPGGNFSMVDMFMSSYLSENVGNPTAAMLYAFSTFFCIPESYQQDDSEALGACWGKEKARELVEKSGLRIIDLIDSMPDSPGMFALCMCQKPQ